MSPEGAWKQNPSTFLFCEYMMTDTENRFWTETKTAFNSETDLSIFKTWNIVQSVPIYSFHQFERDYCAAVFDMIRNNKTPDIWFNALKEPFDGHTEESYASILRNKDSVQYTPWTLKCAHHLLTFVTSSGKSLNDFDQIVEFGAGIGETCRIACDVGYGGNYYLYDLPEVGRVSSYYTRNYPNVKSISNYDQVDAKKKTLFISTWGISETPFNLREAVFRYFSDADYLLIYQHNAFEYDNRTYFTEVFPQIIKKKIVEIDMPFLNHIANGNKYVVTV